MASKAHYNNPTQQLTSHVNPLLAHSPNLDLISLAKQPPPVESTLQTTTIPRPSSLVFADVNQPVLSHSNLYSGTPSSVSAANTLDSAVGPGNGGRNQHHPPLTRMTSLPLGGNDLDNSANFWAMIFGVRSRSLARAKLKQSSQVSALLSGFALVAMVEMDVPAQVPVPLLLFFIIVTTLLVSVHMMALMISTCILPHVESINCMEDRAASYGLLNLDEAYNPLEAVASATTVGTTGTTTNRKNKSQLPSWSPYKKMSFYIDIAWTCSTVIGIFLFILELAFIVWVKFWNTNGHYYIAITSSIILLPVLISLIFFAFHFYQKLISIRHEFTDKVLNELNVLADGLV